MNKIQTVNVSGLENYLSERHEVILSENLLRSGKTEILFAVLDTVQYFEYTLTSALSEEAGFDLLCEWEERGVIVVEEVIG